MNKRRMQFLAVAMAGSTFIFYQNCSPGFEVAGSLKQSSQGGLALSEDIAILSPSIESPVQDQVTLNGRCSTGISVELSGDVVSPTTAPCLSKTFAATVELSGTDGLKTVSVSQTDASGNTKRDNRTFRKDRTPPQLALTAPVANAYASASLIASGVCETGLNVSARIGTVNFSLPCSSGMFSGSLDLSGVADGAGVIAVSQTDLAGNVGSAQQNFIKDSVPPLVAVSSPAANATVTSPLSIQGTCEAGTDVQLSGSGLSSAIATACTATGTFSVSASLSANNGSKSIDFNQTDRAGNSSVAVNLIINRQEMSVPPAISILQPAANTLARTGVTLSGSCVSGLNVTISGAVSAQSSVACTNSAFSSAITFSNGDGAKTITVSQTNASGTVGSDSRTFLKDNTAPVLTIASPATNSVFQTSFTIAGSCETGLPVAISGTGVTGVNATCANGSYSQTVTLSSGDGAKAVQVRQTDAAMNATTVNLSVVRDSTAPVISFSSPAANTEAETGLTIAGSCETGLTVVINGSGVQSMTTTACASGAFSSAILFSAVDGNKVVDISQTDASGNRGQASRTFVRKALVLDGSVLYAQNCQTCHGALASSTKLGRTAAQITSAISQIPSMNYLSTLTSAQVQAVANVLQATTPPTQAFTCNTAEPVNRSPALLQRLTKVQFLNTVQYHMMNGLSTTDQTNWRSYYASSAMSSLVNSMPEDGILGKGSALVYDTEDQRLSPVLLQSQIDVALNAAQWLVSDSSRLNRFVRFHGGSTACPSTQTVSNTTVTDTCLNAFISGFGLKSLRRPVQTSANPTDANSANPQAQNDLAFYSALFKNTTNGGFDTLIASMLLSPDSLFIAPFKGNESAANEITLTSYEVAAKLSYYFTDSPPDSSLIQAAQANFTGTGLTLDDQINRLFSQSQTREKLRRFYTQWFRPNLVPNLNASPEYPNVNLAALRSSAIDEVIDLTEYVTFVHPNAKASDLVTSNLSFARTPELAAIYGVPVWGGKRSDGSFDPATLVSFSSNQPRAGVFTRAAFTFSDNLESDIIIRGARIRRDFLCAEMSPPPNTTLDPSTELANPPTGRNRVTNGTSPTSCRSCHYPYINPLGFALENYDAFGKYRTVEPLYDSNRQLIQTVSIDSQVAPLISSTDTRVTNGGVEFSQLLGESTEFNSCFVRNYFRFAESRRENITADACKLNRMMSVSGSAGSLQTMIKSNAKDPYFNRRYINP